MSKKINESLIKESEKVADILVDAYNSGNKIDKSVFDFICDNIDPKYKKYEMKIMVMITKLIPRNLKLSPNFGEVFIDE